MFARSKLKGRILSCRMVCVSGKVDQVSKAVTLIFNDLTGEEVPNKRKAYFK